MLPPARRDRLAPTLLISLTVFVALALLAEGAARALSVDDLQPRTFMDAQGHTLPYRLWTPRGYDPTKKYGLVLVLHGAGERGTDNRAQLAGQTAPLVFVKPENQARWPVFVVAPQCPGDQQWVAMPWGDASGKGKQPPAPTWPMAASLAALDKLMTEFPGIDPSRLFVTGLSMGGYGAWDAAVRNPKKFRAAVPICGGYDETTMGAIVNLPIWAFHAADDGTVPVQRTRDLIAALKALGGTPQFTEYPASLKYGHFSWNAAYAEPDLLPWMFGPGADVPDAGVVASRDAGARDAGSQADRAASPDTRTVAPDGSVSDGRIASPSGVVDAGGGPKTAGDAAGAPGPGSRPPAGLDASAADPSAPEEPDGGQGVGRRSGSGGCSVGGAQTRDGAMMVALGWIVVALGGRSRHRRAKKAR